MTLSPFADSVYAQPGLTHMVHQYDRNPGQRDSSVLSALAAPSAKAVEAEEDSFQAARETGVDDPSTVSAKMTSHRDAYRNMFDSTSIKRDYTG